MDFEDDFKYNCTFVIINRNYCLLLHQYPSDNICGTRAKILGEIIIILNPSIILCLRPPILFIGTACPMNKNQEISEVKSGDRAGNLPVPTTDLSVSKNII